MSVDGVCSSSILYLFLLHIGYPKDKIIVLHHKGQVHGMEQCFVDMIKSNSLIFLPDADSSEKYSKQLIDKGCCVVDLNHHDLKPYKYSISINNQQSSKVKNKALSGTGLTFQFIRYYCKQHNDKLYKTLLDMVMLGNMSDVMSQKCYPYENRAFNVYGLKKINNPFLKYLCDNLIDDEIIIKDILWNISPLINSLCRSDNQELKELLFDCFVGNSIEYDRCLIELKNQKSKQDYQVKKMMNEVKVLYQGKAMIIECPKTPFTGLVANKLLSQYKCPILLVHLNKGLYSGSVRSNVDLKDLFNDSGLFEWNLGHLNVFGTCFKEENFNSITDFIETLDIKTEKSYIVAHSFNANNIPQELFGLADKVPNYWATDIEYPTFHIKDIELNTSDLQFLNRYKTTIKFTYCGVNYVKEYCSKVWKESSGLNKSNTWLKAECIGKLCLDKYENPTVEIVDIEFEENLF